MNNTGTRMVNHSIMLLLSAFVLQCEPPGDDPIQTDILVNKLIVDNTTGTAHLAVRSDAFVSLPQFALGGEYITYYEEYHVETISMKTRLVREPAFKMIRTDGTDDRVVVSFPQGTSLRGRPAISPEGTAAAIILNTDAGTQRLLHITLHSAAVATMSESSVGVEYSDPCFSADGSAVLFIRTESSSTSSLTSIRISEHTSSTIWSSDTSRLAWPQAITNSNRILFFELQYAPTRKGLRIVNQDGTGYLRIDNAAATETFLPSVAPAGDMIAYYSTTRSNSVLLNSDGTVIRELAISPYSVRTFLQTSSAILVDRPTANGMEAAVFDTNTSLLSLLPFCFYSSIDYSGSTALFAMDTVFVHRILSY